MPNNAEISLRLIRQRGSRDCTIATVAMLTGKTYEEVAAISGQREDGGAEKHADELLKGFGYGLARLYEKNCPAWPPPPFACTHLVTVDVFDHSPVAHVVAMTHDGTVLDPLSDEPKTLRDYHRVYNVAAVVPFEGLTA